MGFLTPDGMDQAVPEDTDETARRRGMAIRRRQRARGGRSSTLLTDRAVEQPSAPGPGSVRNLFQLGGNPGRNTLLSP